MRLLDRYLLRELLVPLTYCLSGFLLLIIVSKLPHELPGLQERLLTGTEIVQYYLTQVPEFLVLILPMALMLALLYTLTNLSRHHEITAIRAAGVSLWRLSLPYFGVGVAASLACFALNELLVPDSAEAAERIRNLHQPPPSDLPGPLWIRDLALHNESGGRVWHARLYNPQTGEMRNVEVQWTLPDGTQLWLNADRGAREQGIWTFYEVRERKVAAEPKAIPVPVLQTNVLARPQFTETLEQIRSDIRISGGISLKALKKPDVPLTAILNYLRLNPNPPLSDRVWLYTMLHGRLATPWTCLVAVLIAIPFGVGSGRRNVYAAVGSSVSLYLVYWLLQQTCLGLGTGHHVASWLANWFPWLAGWLPNLSFGLAGLWLTMRVR
jgi:lipopolysaccharide export system permease protein